jgi:hypothetical protein
VAIERGVRRGAAVALTMARATTDVELQDIKGFPMGEGPRDYKDLLEGFEPAMMTPAPVTPASTKRLTA